MSASPASASRALLHEFLAQIVKERVAGPDGHCTPDGQQTPFRAFIEIVRGAFRLSPSDSEDDGCDASSTKGLRGSASVLRKISASCSICLASERLKGL